MSFIVYLTSTTSACTQHGHDFIPPKLQVALFATKQIPTVRDLKIRGSSCIGRLLMPEAVSAIRSKYLNLNTKKYNKIQQKEVTKTTDIQPNISRAGKMSKAISPIPSAPLIYQNTNLFIYLLYLDTTKCGQSRAGDAKGSLSNPVHLYIHPRNQCQGHGQIQDTQFLVLFDIGVDIKNRFIL